jgi:heme-degrading monooxygenase HmoA
MYLRITRGRFDPAAADRVTPLVSEVSAAVERMPGFQHLYQARDLSGGSIVAISLWDTEEHARFSREDLGEVVTRLAVTGVQLDPPEVFEVV